MIEKSVGMTTYRRKSRYGPRLIVLDSGAFSVLSFAQKFIRHIVCTLAFIVAIGLCFSVPTYGSYYNLISGVGTSARMIGLGNIQGFDNSAAAIFENP